ncbi:MAG: hypothetical protein RLZZ111_1415, partial [Planctomycetota bacterium]
MKTASIPTRHRRGALLAASVCFGLVAATTPVARTADPNPSPGATPMSTAHPAEDTPAGNPALAGRVPDADMPTTE